MGAGRLFHVMVFVKDLERMVEFYGKVFALGRRNTSDAGYVEMVAGEEVVVALHSLPADIASQITIESPPAWRDESATKMCFDAADLGAQRQAILDHGGQAKDPWAWEQTHFCECTDPEGNVIQIFNRSRDPLEGA